VSDVKTKIDATRNALRKALLAGDRTDQLRAYLLELEAEQKTADDTVAAQDAAQRAAKEVAAQRVADAADDLAEARANRLDALLARFKAATHA
jgi:hypothetical protein